MDTQEAEDISTWRTERRDDAKVAVSQVPKSTLVRRDGDALTEASALTSRVGGAADRDVVGAVAGSAWTVVSENSMRQAYRDLQALLVLVGLLAVALLVFVVALGRTLFARQRRRHAEELVDAHGALAVSEQRLREAQRIANIGSWEFDLGSKKITWSDEVFRIFELDPGSSQGSYDAFFNAVHPDDREAVNGDFARALESKLPYRATYRVRSASGRTKTVHLNAETVFSEDGTPLRSFGTLQDVTARVTDAEVLRETQQRLAVISDNLPGGVVFQIDGGVDGTKRELTYVSAGIEGVGLTVEAVRADVSSLYGQILLEDRPTVDAAEAASLSALAPLDVEYRITDGNGAVRWMLSKASPRKSSNGHIIWDGLVIDITDRKQAELRVRAVLETLPVGVLAADNDTGELVLANEALCQMLGYSHEELSKLRPMDLHPASAVERVASEFARMVSGESIFAPDVPTQRRDGSVFWSEIRASHVDLGGRSLNLAVFLDITERRAAQDDYQLLFSEMLDGFALHEIICDEDGTPVDYRFLDVNPSFERLTGLRKVDLVGRCVRDVLPEAEETWIERYGSVALSGVPAHFESYTASLQKQFRVTAFQSGPGRFACIFEDITERKRIEMEIEAHREHLEDLVQRRTVELSVARSRAEAANAAKTSFLANMSHEIRTPLNAILGLTHLMRRDARPAELERLTKIDTAGHHLLSIINDILDLSKIEAGRMHIEHANFHLSAVLDHVRSLVAAQAAAKDLIVTVDHDDVPAWLRGDATRLRQTLLNLAGNAVKFTATGSIALQAKRIEDAPDGSMLVRFTVTDTGVGISDTDQVRLFQPFEQADATTTRLHGGTGLGLTIARRLAQLMGGDMGVSSTPGLGSSFWFTVRLEHGHGVMPPTNDRSIDDDAECVLRERHTGARILVAEDNAINRDVALELLLGAGLSVDLAVDGVEAVAKGRASPYDLVLMDMQMPNLDGLDATRALRDLVGWAHVPIVAMTANAFEEHRQACLAAGMNDFVAKPVDPQLLYRTMLRWLPRTAAKTPLSPTSTVAIDAAAAAERRALHADYDGIVGLDIDKAPIMASNRPQLLRRLLVMFVEHYANDGAALRQATEAEAARLAHALKSAAGNIGAEDVAACASRVQAAVRERRATASVEPDLPALLVVLADKVDALIAALRGVQHRSPNQTHVLTADATAVVEALKVQLRESDAEAAEIAAREEALLRQALGASKAHALLQHIAAFDFDLALQLLEHGDEERTL